MENCSKCKRSFSPLDYEMIDEPNMVPTTTHKELGGQQRATIFAHAMRLEPGLGNRKHHPFSFDRVTTMPKRGNSWDQGSGTQWSGSGRANTDRGGDGAWASTWTSHGASYEPGRRSDAAGAWASTGTDTPTDAAGAWASTETSHVPVGPSNDAGDSSASSGSWRHDQTVVHLADGTVRSLTSFGSTETGRIVHQEHAQQHTPPACDPNLCVCKIPPHT